MIKKKNETGAARPEQTITSQNRPEGEPRNGPELDDALVEVQACQILNDIRTRAGMPTETRREALPKLAYTMAETAEMLGISYISVHRLIQRGLLRSSRALRHKIISRREIDRFLATTTE
jgi:DNA-directed RNA polymerase specialized sigma24 family protein